MHYAKYLFLQLICWKVWFHTFLLIQRFSPSSEPVTWEACTKCQVHPSSSPPPPHESVSVRMRGRGLPSPTLETPESLLLTLLLPQRFLTNFFSNIGFFFLILDKTQELVCFFIVL